MLERVIDLQIAATLCRHLNLDRNSSIGMRHDGRHLLNFAGADDLAITVHFIRNREIIIEGDEIHVVVQGNRLAILIKGRNAHRAVYVLELHQAGVRTAIRIDQTIHAEIAVVRILAMVAAVQILLPAILSLARIDRVITPFPDECAAHHFVGLDEPPVVLQISRTVAHSMSIFTHEIRLIRFTVYILLKGFQRGIHVAVEIDVGEIILALAAAILRAFIVRQSCRIKMLRPGQRRFKAAAIGTFVTHGPADHAGTVLITLNTSLRAVKRRLHELRIIGKRLIPLLNVIRPDVVLTAVQLRRAMAFMIGLIDHEETVLITQLVEHRRVRVMAGTDGVEVVLLDHLQVALHMIDADHRTGHRIGIMAVDTPELDDIAIQIDLIVFNMNLTQTNAIHNDLVRRLEDQRIQVRLLRIPKNRMIYRKQRLEGVRAAVECRHIILGNSLSYRIQQLNLGRDRSTFIGKADADFGFAIHDLHRREVITDAFFRALEQIHIAEDTRGPELILVLQITAVVPLENQHSQLIVAFLDIGSDVKLAGRVGNLAVSDVLTIHPDIEAGVNAFKIQVSLRRFRIHSVFEIADIRTAGIIIRHIGRICRERILDVRVLMLIVTMVLPDAGHRDRVPIRRVVALIKEELLKLMNALTILELPVSAQKLESIGVLTVLHKVIHARRRRNVVRAVRHSAQMVHVQVFVKRGNDHVCILLISAKPNLYRSFTFLFVYIVENLPKKMNGQE